MDFTGEETNRRELLVPLLRGYCTGEADHCLAVIDLDPWGPRALWRGLTISQITYTATFTYFVL